MQLADIFRAEREAILEEWEAEVRKAVSPSASLSQNDLRDDIPRFLDRLSDWLSGDSRDTSKAVAPDTTGKHASHRLQHGVELRDLIHEFRLLRQIILRRVIARASLGDRLEPDFGRLADALDHAMTESAAAYARAREQSREMVLAILGTTCAIH